MQFPSERAQGNYCAEAIKIHPRIAQIEVRPLVASFIAAFDVWRDFSVLRQAQDPLGETSA